MFQNLRLQKLSLIVRQQIVTSIFRFEYDRIKSFSCSFIFFVNDVLFVNINLSIVSTLTKASIKKHCNSHIILSRSLLRLKFSTNRSSFQVFVYFSSDKSFFVFFFFALVFCFKRRIFIFRSYFVPFTNFVSIFNTEQRIVVNQQSIDFNQQIIDINRLSITLWRTTTITTISILTSDNTRLSKLCFLNHLQSLSRSQSNSEAQKK